MNIIEKMRAVLESYPRISEVCGSVHAELAGSEPADYGLSSIGDTLMSEDILGNQKRQHTFLFYAVYSGINDYERLCNSSALLDLAKWLEGQENTGISQWGKQGVITKIRGENGMLAAIPQENTNDALQYQLQITAEYTIPAGT